MAHKLADFRRVQQRRLASLAIELGGGAYHSILFTQVWCATEEDRGRSCGRPQDLPQDVVLRTEAQSAFSYKNECIAPYASLSKLCGVRGQSMDLIGDCLLKGATRLIEDLTQADPRQHPCNLLPGDNMPACSALFLPIYDPSDPLSRGTSSPRPSAVLEVLVCKRAEQMHHHSDLMNVICRVMDVYQFGVSADTGAFREWSRKFAGQGTPRSEMHTPGRTSPSSMARTTSMCLLSSDSDDSEQSQAALGEFCRPQHGARKAPEQRRALPGYAICSMGS